MPFLFLLKDGGRCRNLVLTLIAISLSMIVKDLGPGRHGGHALIIREPLPGRTRFLPRYLLACSGEQLPALHCSHSISSDWFYLAF